VAGEQRDGGGDERAAGEGDEAGDAEDDEGGMAVEARVRAAQPQAQPREQAGREEGAGGATHGAHRRLREKPQPTRTDREWTWPRPCSNSGKRGEWTHENR
jgi:hypothetical protein